MMAATLGLEKSKNSPENEASWTVFLVDDDMDDQLLAERVLGKSPMIKDVVSVSSSEALFKELRSRHFFYDMPGDPPNSLIMLDIHMPGVDGIALLNQLRTSPYTEGIPVIMLTGDSRTSNIEKTYYMEANGYITKPLSGDHLDHIHAVLARGKNWKDK